MTTDLVTVEKADRIAVVRFDRGDPANALSFALMRGAHRSCARPDR